MKFRYFILLVSVCSTVIQASTNVLIVGDSHTVLDYGMRLDQNLRLLKELNVSTYGVWGVKASEMLSGATTTTGYFERVGSRPEIRIPNGKKVNVPKFEELLQRHHPDLVVISLGHNSSGYDDFGYAQNKELMEKILLNGSQCIWVGPPKTSNYSGEKSQGIYRGLRRATQELGSKYQKSCKLIDSRPHEPHDEFLEPDQSLEVGGYGLGPRYPVDGRGDTYHFNFRPEGKKLYFFWADQVFEQITNLQKWPRPASFRPTLCPYQH